MTPDEIDTAIAEFRGWTGIESIAKGARPFGYRPNPDGERYPLVAVPQYHKCLNACHEAEEGLGAHLDDYEDQLANLFTDGFLRGRYTAIQRAEALLRTISKWQEPIKLQTHIAV